MKLGMNRRPTLVQMVIIHTNISFPQIDVSVEDNFESVTMHASTPVVFRHVRESMRRFKNVAPPNVRLLIPIKIHAFMQSALNADLLNSWKCQLCPDPTREILIGRLIESVIKQLVIERRDASGKLLAKFANLAPRECCPVRRQTYPDFRKKTVPVQASRSMTFRKYRHLPSGLECGGRHIQNTFVQAAVLPKRRWRGSTLPSSAKPLFRRRQESHLPHGSPFGPGS